MVSIKAAINQGPLAFHLDRRPDGTEYMSEPGNILYWSKKKKKKNTPCWADEAFFLGKF